MKSFDSQVSVFGSIRIPNLFVAERFAGFRQKVAQRLGSHTVLVWLASLPTGKIG